MRDEASDTPEQDRDDRPGNEVSGAANKVVQAGTVSGGVHFHGSAHAGGSTPRQLPADIPGFVNRAADLARLDVIMTGHRVGRNAVTICVVVGTAGVGKTSLAVHWAHQVRRDFPDGQLYANLHGYDPGPPIDAHEVLGRFLRALGIAAEYVPTDLESRAALYRSQLAERRMLVVLDNVAAASHVRLLLPGGNGCLVLVTSRSRLSGLVARDGAYRLTLGVLSDAEAIALLRTVTEHYRTTDDADQLEELARLCARLPLALRVAAERAVSRPQMPLSELISDLRDESALWDALSADEDDESAAVRSVFAWSYRALTPDACRLFRLLGLHPGPDFGSAAVAAFGDLTIGRARRLLDDLVGAHLIEQAAPDRYQFHDLLRAYAADRARSEEPGDELRAALGRILLWYLHTASAVSVALVPYLKPFPLTGADTDVNALTFDDHEQATAWYEQERINLVAAVRTADDLAMHDIAWQTPTVLRGVYANLNHFDDWITASAIGLGAARQQGVPHAEAMLLGSLGKAYVQSGSRRQGVDYHIAALAIHHDVGDRAGELESMNAIGLTHLLDHELGAALAYFERARAVAVELADDYWSATLSTNIANVYLDMERFAEAIDLLPAALTIYQRLGFNGSEGDALRGLSQAHRGVGNLDQAQLLIERALVIAQQHDNRVWEAFWLIDLGHVQVARGELAAALTSYHRAATVQRRLGDRGREAGALDSAGETYQKLGRLAEAAGFHRVAIAVFRELGDDWQLALALDNLAITLAATGALADARVVWQEALVLIDGFMDTHARRIRSRISGTLAVL